MHVLAWVGIGAAALVAAYFGLAYYIAKRPQLYGDSCSRRYDD